MARDDTAESHYERAFCTLAAAWNASPVLCVHPGTTVPQEQTHPSPAALL